MAFIKLQKDSYLRVDQIIRFYLTTRIDDIQYEVLVVITPIGFIDITNNPRELYQKLKELFDITD